MRTAGYTYRNGRRLSQRKKAICRFEYHVDRFPGRTVEERTERKKETEELRAKEKERERRKRRVESGTFRIG